VKTAPNKHSSEIHTKGKVDDDVMCAKVLLKVAVGAWEVCAGLGPAICGDSRTAAHDVRRRRWVAALPEPYLHEASRTLKHKVTTTDVVEVRAERVGVGG
jgi:hypothetical protein